MLGLRGLLYLALAGAGAVFSAVWTRQLIGASRTRRLARSIPAPGDEPALPAPSHLAVGFVTDFLDTLGVGSFATTTALYRLLRLVPDHLIPGTLLIGHTLPTLGQAFIYITIVEVEVLSLVLLITTASLGSWLGAGIVAGWSRRRVQLGMGLALPAAAVVMLAQLLGLLPAGGQAVGLSGWRLAVGLLGNFGLGALMTIGIGAYAPSLIMFGLLDMNVKSIFPIMMGSCAMLMPIAGVRFLERGSYSARAALGLAVAGLPAVLIAALLVKSLPLALVRWLVLAVVVYTALAMIRPPRQETSNG